MSFYTLKTPQCPCDYGAAIFSCFAGQLLDISSGSPIYLHISTINLNYLSLQVAGKADDDLQGRNALYSGNNLHFDTDDLKADHRRFARQATTTKGTTTTKKAAATTKKITGTTKKSTTVKVTTKKANLANAVNYSCIDIS